MSGDQLVFDMSSAPEGQASVFVRKDWLSLQDSNNNSYVGNNIIISTDMIANSNRYCDFRNAYLLVPLLITMTAPIASGFAPAEPAGSADCAISLKNFYGSIIHSIQIDMNGSTISQTVPFIGLYNAFKLCTTLSFQDAISQGPTIGFWMDNALSVGCSSRDSPSGSGTTNNRNGFEVPDVTGKFAQAGCGFNEGFYRRQSFWNFDPDALMPGGGDAAYGNLISPTRLNQVWKSYIFQKQDASSTRPGVWQANIMATIYLKHISDYFLKSPLLKGCFYRLSIFLNQSSVTFTKVGGDLTDTIVNCPLGGVNPIMIASALGPKGAAEGEEPDANQDQVASGSYGLADDVQYTVSLAVGAQCLNTAQSSLQGVKQGELNRGVLLCVPSYVFNPIFESAYISSEVKHIEYCSQYNYQIMNIQSGNSFNQNLTNGIANIKSLLFLPFFTAAANGVDGIMPIQSPYDACGGGLVSPYALLGNFQAQISGANVLYNASTYLHQSWNQQTQGVNAVNAGLTDGLTSGMFGRAEWEASPFYYLDAGRCLPVEESVPKSVSVSGQNLSSLPIDIYCFITYGVSIDVSVLSGARV